LHFEYVGWKKSANKLEISLSSDATLLLRKWDGGKQLDFRFELTKDKKSLGLLLQSSLQRDR